VVTHASDPRARCLLSLLTSIWFASLLSLPVATTVLSPNTLAFAFCKVCHEASSPRTGKRHTAPNSCATSNARSPNPPPRLYPVGSTLYPNQ